jgi:hypothetical protein
MKRPRARAFAFARASSDLTIRAFARRESARARHVETFAV